MELGYIGVDWKVTVHYRKESMPPVTPAGLCLSGSQTKWENTYGFLSVDALGVSIEGMNEKGLAASGLIFETGAYPFPKPGKKMNVTICSGNVIQWALGNFASVKELSAALLSKGTQILGPLSQESDHATPSDLNRLRHLSRLHWAFDDAQGGHIVVEVVDGNVVVHNNAVGVLTNDPDYTWHLRNLNNYAFLSSEWTSNAQSIAIESEIGASPRVVSHGLNLMGLPGDAGPSSRFVRLFYLRQFALHRKPPSALSKSGRWNQTFAIVDGLLNTVWVVEGTVAPNAMVNESTLEKTDFSVVKSSSDRMFHFRSYGNSRWKRIDLSSIPWDLPSSKKSTNPSMPVVDGTLGIDDVTDRLA